MLDTPLFDGERIGNVYPSDPVLGLDGCFHVAWVWRGTGGAATNHDLCHARSRELVHWETAASEPVELPLTERTRVCRRRSGVGLRRAAQHRLRPRLRRGRASSDQLLQARRASRTRRCTLPDRGPATRADSTDRWQIVAESHWTGRYIPERVGYIDPPPAVSPCRCCRTGICGSTIATRHRRRRALGHLDP